MQISSLGFSRIGQKRELKFSLERYWRGEIDVEQLQQTGKKLRKQHWQWQAQAGVDLMPVGDFAFYDHVLNLSALLNVIPKRHRNKNNPAKIDLDTLFLVARGQNTLNDDCCLAASEMTKFFNTNYHYIVPEITEKQSFSIGYEQIFTEIEEAKALDYEVKPVLLGPVTYLYLARQIGSKFNKLSLLPNLLEAYQQILDRFAEQGVTWVQLDEPILTLELDVSWRQGVIDSYHKLKKSSIKILLASYFGSIEHNAQLISNLSIDGFHLDLVSDPQQLTTFLPLIRSDQTLSIGVVDGRNVWSAELDLLAQKLVSVAEELADRLWLSPSCSLLHCPVDLELETKLALDIKNQLAFAKQKLHELEQLRLLLTQPQTQYAQSIIAHCQNRRQEKLKRRLQSVTDRIEGLTEENYLRNKSFNERLPLQQAKLKLPFLPTTSIGSFPQTSALRGIRNRWRKNEITDDEYQIAVETLTKDCILKQQKLGLDVLVHGEAERNDMVEYFADKLTGIEVTEFAWVQSYGSRCVKPPLIYGDVSRKKPMTLALSQFSQAQTEKPVKGMLTGPVTLLHWSFVRQDIPKATVANQLALAVRDEVDDLQKSGIDIIQIDEPALREGLPLRKTEWEHYLDWSVKAFKLSASVAWDETQIHTHMCYSNFNDIIEAIANLDADVITIETSRSGMNLLNAFEDFNYPNQIGPGVYDIHSPNTPSVESIKRLIIEASKKVPINQLWINPDCGLKTRSWDEVEPALKNMVQAARELRTSFR